MDAGTLAFFSYAANLAVQGVDSFLTNAGLAKGMKEAWLVGGLIKKFGQAKVDLVKMGLIPFAMIAVPLMLGAPEYANYLNFTMAAVTVPIVVRNFIVLKKAKISIFG